MSERKRDIELILPLLLVVLVLVPCGATPAHGADKEKATVLPTLVVKPRKYKMLHLIGYVREYSTMSTYYDTVQLFREKTVDFMIPAAKDAKGGWLRPRLLASRSFYRFANYEGLDSVSDRFREHFSWSDWAELFRRTEIPLSIRTAETAGAADTIRSDSKVSAVWRRTDDDSMTLDVDMLADRSNRQWMPAFAGLLDGGDDTEFRRLMLKYYFTDIDSKVISPQNLTRFDIDVRSGGRGRSMRHIFHTSDTIYVDTHAEFYITDREYLNGREAGRWEKHPPKSHDIGIHAPADAPAITAFYADIVARVDNIDHDRLRIEAETDKLLIGPRYNNLLKKNYGPVRQLWEAVKKLPGWLQKHI